MSKRNQEIFKFIRSQYPQKSVIALHEPVFAGKEKEYVDECIRSTMVSSVGEFVNRFEKMVAHEMGCKFAVVTSSGTTALQLALQLVGVGPDDLVLTQALTFVATANAISHCGAQPVLLDVDAKTMGLDPNEVRNFLEKECTQSSQGIKHKASGRSVKACVPVHMLGHPTKIVELKQVCAEFNLPIVEDAAEALGSFVNGQACGSFGDLGVMSFNGNKIVTTGGGGAIVTNNEELAVRAKHLSTTAKVPHAWEYFHDQVAYNYRMPNLNAALGCAQLEQLPQFLKDKRELAHSYQKFFNELDIPFLVEAGGTKANYWLNAIYLEGAEARDQFLKEAVAEKIYARPLWHLMSELPMYKTAIRGQLKVATNLREQVVCLPSGVRSVK